MSDRALHLSELLVEARAVHAGLGAFTCYDLETGAAVLRAAGEVGAPVVLLVSARSLETPDGTGLVAGLVELVHASEARACVELDHLDRVPEARALVRWRSPALMVDASALPLEENREVTRAAVEVANAAGCEVEGELGRLAGDEDVVAPGRCGSLTRPDEARSFVEDSGIACLAISIGNAHGAYMRTPSLDWERLARLEASVPVPLALHGASGIAPEDVRRAIAGGVTKVNFNTDLRARYFEAMASGVVLHRGALDLIGLKEHLTEAMHGAVAGKLDLLGWPKRTGTTGGRSRDEGSGYKETWRDRDQ